MKQNLFFCPFCVTSTRWVCKIGLLPACCRLTGKNVVYWSAIEARMANHRDVEWDASQRGDTKEAVCGAFFGQLWILLSKWQIKRRERIWHSKTACQKKKKTQIRAWQDDKRHTQTHTNTQGMIGKVTGRRCSMADRFPLTEGDIIRGTLSSATCANIVSIHLEWMLQACVNPKNTSVWCQFRVFNWKEIGAGDCPESDVDYVFFINSFEIFPGLSIYRVEPLSQLPLWVNTGRLWGK